MPDLPSLVVYPGTFDPPTLGHLDIIRRGLTVFDRVIAAVAENPEKVSLFDAQERRDLLREATRDLEGVTVTGFDGLTVDFVRSHGARAILRGIRSPADADYEEHLALTNRTVGGVETVLVIAGEQSSYVSSSLVKEVARLGGDVSAMVPPCVEQALKRKLA